MSIVNRPYQHKVGTCGRLIPGQEARLVKEDGHDAAGGEAGELWVRGDNIVRSYYGNAKATDETFTKDGWPKTGDVGIFDKDGYLSIVDRTKELIKYKASSEHPYRSKSDKCSRASKWLRPSWRLCYLAAAWWLMRLSSEVHGTSAAENPPC